VGVLVLGAKRSELPYSADDRSLLRAVASAAALVLTHGFRAGQAPDWKNATEPGDTGPGVECVDCGRLQATGAPSLTCRACGGRTQAASLPDVVAGKYKVERRIGAGGMGVVYLAREIRLDRFVVLKTLPRVSNADVSHLNTEARAMAALQHENLAVIFGAERWRDRPVLIMEYLSGGTLADQLRQRRLSPYEAVSLGIVLVQALAHLHKRRLLHRDIKPSNIGFTEEGAPKLLDFGLSFFLPTTEIMAAETRTIHTLVEWVRTGTDPWSPQTLATHAQMVVGTPAYLCPEAIAMKPADARFDLWSLAVTLYESVAGVNPFQAENTLQTLVRIAHSKAPDIRQFRPDCSDAHASFFALALDPDASRRPASAADFRMALRELVREPV
jgi:eukaryotic-like serine/threonine-protein kinase